MDKQIDQSPDTQNTQAADAPSVQTGASRRKFTRGAVLGGAVVLSLGNRAAWSFDTAVCLSAKGMIKASAQTYLAGGAVGSVSVATQSEIDRFSNLPPETQQACDKLGLGLSDVN